ncbi:MAG: tetratricopeptide repeat protein [Defluviicoccus sp.]|nr:MAG: tetratricopeptide repeat protein [Defluviicoccus sp.]
MPLQWATTQNNLGLALQTLGERESGTARLEDAVTAYRAALQEYTRERVPLQWATTQNNLGGALWTLALRTDDLAMLQEARAAVDGAFEVHAGRAGALPLLLRGAPAGDRPGHRHPLGAPSAAGRPVGSPGAAPRPAPVGGLTNMGLLSYPNSRAGKDNGVTLRNTTVK